MPDSVTKRGTQRSLSETAASGFQSLLVSLDLTPGSDRVLGRVTLLPLADDARITLLHVVPRLPPAEQRSAERDARKAIAEEVRHLRKLLPRTVSIEPLVTLGAAAKEIAKCAKKTRAELIVMGRGGGRALRDTFLGSTAERVIRQAQLPVLVVRLPPRATYDRPALALDRDQAAHEIVHVMLRMLPPPRPRVLVVHAFQFPYQGLVYPSLESRGDDRRAALHASVTNDLRRLLASALTKAGSHDKPVWKTHVRYGSPHAVVEKATRNAETDLLMLGTHGYSGAAYMFLGTVAGDLLRAAKCDVLVVPPAPSA